MQDLAHPLQPAAVAAPGELMVSCRHDSHPMTTAQCGAAATNASRHCRVQAYSVDGGRKFGNFTTVHSLPDTPLKGGLARWVAKKALLFSNPDVTLDPCPAHCVNSYGAHEAPCRSLQFVSPSCC